MVLDTGFTDWLAIDVQDINDLGWLFVKKEKRQTARGEAVFYLYIGTVLFDNQELTIPILAGKGITEVLLGLQWLETRQLVANRKTNLLMLTEE